MKKQEQRAINAKMFIALDKINEALYDKSADTLYDVLRGVYGYTATSAQHIAKFRNICNPAHVLTYREV